MPPKRTGKSENIADASDSDLPSEAGAVSTLRDAAYAAIKHSIITCAFRPGEHLNEMQLAVALKIGRTPVHQALERLMFEGMVEMTPGKGVVVKPVSLKQVLQIIEVRLINEPLSARLAAQNADETELTELAEVLERAKQSVIDRSIQNMMLLDRDFHLLIAKAAKNDVLIEFLRGLHERSLRFWFISLNAPEQYESVQIEHMAIFEAIKKHDAAGAEAAMRRHIESFRSNVTNLL